MTWNALEVRIACAMRSWYPRFYRLALLASHYLEDNKAQIDLDNLIDTCGVSAFDNIIKLVHMVL